jgi:hypothetical protein
MDARDREQVPVGVGESEGLSAVFSQEKRHFAEFSDSQ